MKLPLRYPACCLALILLSIAQPLLAFGASGAASGKDCQEIVVVSQQLWVLSKAGKIKVYDAAGNYRPLPAVEAVKAYHLAVDGDKVVAQVGPTLQRWNGETAAWETVGKLGENVFGMVVSSQHRVFAITSLGVLDVQTGRRTLPTSSPNHQVRLASLAPPAAYFMDAQDNLWIGYGYGEWGGNIFTYSTSQHKFLTLRFNDFRIELNPVKSFFQLKNSVGVSAGLQHFSTAGAVAEFTELSAHVLYNTWADRDTTKTRQPFADNQPYIGPATYDAPLNRLYFYSHLGVYEVDYGGNLARLTSWRKVFKPDLHWRSGQPDAVGSPMNVLQMLSLGDGRLVLLTQNDGIGIWDGHAFKALP